MDRSPTTEAQCLTDVSPRRNLAGMYLCIIAGLPLVLLILAFPIMNSPFFKKYGDPESIRAQRSLFESAHRNCEVLMFGDSTAEAGLDPAIIKGITRLSTCNMATTGPTLHTLGLDPLDRYLARNPRPRYLVLQFASPELHQIKLSAALLDHFDGVIQSIRYYGWGQSLPLFLHNPDYFFGILNYVYRQGTSQMLLAAMGKRTRVDSQQPDSYIVISRPALTSCPLYNGDSSMPDPAWIDYLRLHYSSAADHVLIEVSPTSPCNDLYSLWKGALGKSVDNELELYPNNLFVDGNFHLSREGAIRRSRELAQQILEEESSNAADQTHLPAPEAPHPALN